MASAHHLAEFLKGARHWNGWRSENPEFIPDLKDVVISLAAQGQDALAFCNVNLRSALLQNSSIAHGLLLDADFEGADLRGADLSGARLQNANFCYADLSTTKLDGANLSNARLFRTDLRHIDLRYTHNVSQEQINWAIGDETTLLPSYLQKPTAWLTIEPRHISTESFAQQFPLGPRGAATINKNDRQVEVRARGTALPDGQQIADAAAKASRSRRSGRVAIPVGLMILCLCLAGVGWSVSALWQHWSIEADHSAWAQAEKTGTQSSVAAYLNERPEGLHAYDARKRLAEIKIEEKNRRAALAAQRREALVQEETRRRAALEAEEAKSRAALAAAVEKHADDELWSRAKSSGAIGDMERYLTEHPNGAHAGAAKEKLAALKADEARRRAALEEEEAKDRADLADAEEEKRADDAAWVKAQDGDTIGDIENYLANRPNGRHVPAARERLAALESEDARRRAALRAEEVKRRAAQEATETRRRRERDAALAEQRADDKAWEKSLETATPSAVQAYIDERPNGRHVSRAREKLAALVSEVARRRAAEEAAEARRREALEADEAQRRAALEAAAEEKRVDDAAWAAAQNDGTVTGIKSYLEKQPNGSYVAAARQKLAALEADEEQNRRANENNTKKRRSTGSRKSKPSGGSLEKTKKPANGKQNGVVKEKKVASKSGTKKAKQKKKVRRRAQPVDAPFVSLGGGF